jgi:hypothetical protein
MSGILQVIDDVAAMTVRRTDQRLTEFRDEMLKRIDALPVELARDDTAMALIKDRMTRDLADIFENKQGP